MDYIELKTNSGIYKIISEIDDKVYVGSSVNLRGRINRHLRELMNNNHHSPHLQNAFNKYGNENFKVVVLEEYDRKDITKKTLIEREQHYLDILKPFLKENGYNTCPIAASPNIGKLSDETREKISKSLMGRPVSQETRNKLSLAHKNKVMSKDAIEKIRKSKIGLKQSEENISKRAKKYSFIGPDGVIYMGKNLKRFADKHKLHRTNLNSVLSGKRKSHHGFKKYIT